MERDVEDGIPARTGFGNGFGLGLVFIRLDVVFGNRWNYIGVSVYIEVGEDIYPLRCGGSHGGL